MSQAKRIVIVGGVAGGASCAARARRLSETAEIVIYERGHDVSFANCGMPYHIGLEITDRSKLLVQTPRSMARRFNIDVRVRHEVLSIDPAARKLTVRNLDTGQEFTDRYDSLVLSPGAQPIRPPIPGADTEGVFTLRSLNDMDAIKQIIDDSSPARAVVVGGGYIGLEMTEALGRRGVEVTLVELASQVFAAADFEMTAPIQQQLTLHGVDLRLETSVDSIKRNGNSLAVALSTGESVDCGLIILAIGVKPEVSLARDAGLEIGQTGGIAVDEHMRTSHANIFAVGDAVQTTHLVGGHDVTIPLAGPANRQGRIAADNIFGRDSIYRHTQGTAICKIFDQTIAMTGLSEKLANKLSLPCEKVYVHPLSHAGYYPGAASISLKLLFDPTDGRILGAQAVGADGVDKRIDVIATAIRAGLTVRDLCDLELCYAPPYGSARDPVNYAGFVASNVLDGDVAICHSEDMLSAGDDKLLLDVRTPAEVEAGTIGQAVNIPLDQLRSRIDELPADKELFAFCAAGLRGYLACRILSQHGLKCRNLSGGYKTFRDATASQRKDSPVNPTSSAPKPSSCCTAKPDCKPEIEIDARGMQCPGPIMRLKTEIEKLATGQAVSIIASDGGFAADIAGWCSSTGNQLLQVLPEGNYYRAVIVKGSVTPATSADVTSQAHTNSVNKKTIVVFSGDFDKAMAGFIIANGAAAMGSEVTMFFTFWGLNVLRRDEKVKVQKNIVERMFSWMMPRGPQRLALSKMNMGGLGKRMIQGIMRAKNVASLPELITSARDAGVRLVACSMSMDLMGIRQEELIDGVETGGVAMYLNQAENGNVNLFI